MAFSFKALLFKIFMSDLIPLNKNATMLIGYDQDDDGIPDDFDFATADDLKETTDAIKKTTDKQSDLLKDAFLFTKATQGKDEAGKPIVTLSNNNGDEFKFSIGGGGGGSSGTYNMTLTAPYLNLLENDKIISRVELPIENGKWLGVPPIGGTEIMTGDIIYLGVKSGLNMSTVYDNVDATKNLSYDEDGDYMAAVFHQVNMPKDFKAGPDFSLDTKIELKLTHLLFNDGGVIKNARSDSYLLNGQEIIFNAPYITTWSKISAPGSKTNFLTPIHRGYIGAELPVFTTSRFIPIVDHIKVFNKNGTLSDYNPKTNMVSTASALRIGLYSADGKLVPIASTSEIKLTVPKINNPPNVSVINGMYYISGGTYIINLEKGVYNMTYGGKTFSIILSDDSGNSAITTSGEWITKGTTAYNNAQTVFNRLTQELGISGAAAAGVMGNIAHESRFDPSAENVSDGGHGLIQWTFGRRAELVRRAGQAGTSINDLNMQIDYLIDEMKQPSNWVSGMWIDNSLAKFSMCTDPQEAAMRFYVSQMEAGGGRTGDPDGTGPQRKAYAQKAYELFN